MSMIFDFFPMVLGHIAPGDVTALTGFLHPILGLDHLLAMVTVGLLSAQIGGRAIWTVPTAFVGMMVLGAVIGLFGSANAFLEYGIAASVILLGVALLVQQYIPELLALIVVGVFALFHGYAHGEPLPPDQNFVFFISFTMGFVLSTAGMHIIGALIGYIVLRAERGVLIMRALGLVIALFGISFFIAV